MSSGAEDYPSIGNRSTASRQEQRAFGLGGPVRLHNRPHPPRGHQGLVATRCRLPAKLPHEVRRYSTKEI